ncbi:MAG: sialate O-acetylesterase [Akkermansiaceae bacterium]|jgi:hypothetical protein
MTSLRLFTVFFLTLVFSLQAEDVAKEDLHIYLLIGQSNMAGRAPVDQAKAGPIEGVLLLNATNEWEAAKNPLNRYSTIRKGLGMQKLNPGYSFAKAMRKANPKATIGLVVNAKGGSSIEQWATDKKFYKDIITRATAAQKTGTLKGILWHQGESNSSRADIYPGQLKALVENLRKDLGVANLPFVAGEIKEGEKINAGIAKLPTMVPHTGVASSKGLKTMDRWHFDAPSMISLGERYATEMLKLQKK